MSRDIRIELDKDEIQCILDGIPYYTMQSNCDIEIVIDTEGDCPYCEGRKYVSQHFKCEVCGIGMCSNCYNEEKEHDGHYHQVCEDAEDDLYDKIIKKIGDEPDYICEKCLGEIEN